MLTNVKTLSPISSKNNNFRTWDKCRTNSFAWWNCFCQRKKTEWLLRKTWCICTLPYQPLDLHKNQNLTLLHLMTHLQMMNQNLIEEIPLKFKIKNQALLNNLKSQIMIPSPSQVWNLSPTDSATVITSRAKIGKTMEIISNLSHNRCKLIKNLQK